MLVMSDLAMSAVVIADPIDEALRTSESTFRSPRMVDAVDTSAVDGHVVWKPVKSLWISSMTLAAHGRLLIARR